MNYYIADLHFGHQNIIPMAQRPFQCASEMEETLIKNWNRKVNESDDIYIVGDLFFQHDHIVDLLASLKGKKHLILGNHEVKWLTDELKSYFVSIDTVLEIVDQNHTIYMCHYPMVSYPKQSRAYMVHGHIHNDTLFDYWCVLLKRPRILNAGVDINHFEPVTLNEMIINNEHYKAQIQQSYPMHLLSVRFHLHELKQLHLSKEELHQQLSDYLIKHNIQLYREGLYKIDKTQLDFISALQQKILNDDKLHPLIKNFDVVFIDNHGNYHYLSYLDKNTIYMK